MRKISTNKNERGFVLVIVLWLIAVLTIFAATFSLSAQGGIKLVDGEINAVMERAYLDGGVELAAFHSSMSPPLHRWRADGRIYHKSIGNADLRIRLYDQSGNIDINKADPSLLLGLLRQFIPDPNAARRLTAKIISGRKKNKPPQINGRPNLRKNPPSPSRPNATLKYMDISQLQYETGMTREIYQSILPFITVHSKDGRINPLTAPLRVLMSIPTLSKFDIDKFIEARRLDPMNKRLIKDLPSSARKWVTKTAGPAIKVVVNMNTQSGNPSQFLSAIILPLIDRKAPFRILRRQFVTAPPALRKGPL